ALRSCSLPFLLHPPPPRPTLFPYTTLFRSNLGIILLFAPLAAVPPGGPLRDGLLGVLGRLDVADARAAYEAIRLANPAGLGRVRSEEHTSELQSLTNLVCRLLLGKQETYS